MCLNLYIYAKSPKVHLFIFRLCSSPHDRPQGKKKIIIKGRTNVDLLSWRESERERDKARTPHRHAINKTWQVGGHREGRFHRRGSTEIWLRRARGISILLLWIGVNYWRLALLRREISRVNESERPRASHNCQIQYPGAASNSCIKSSFLIAFK